MLTTTINTLKNDQLKGLKVVSDLSAPVILLSHTPDMFPQIPSTVFLTLSGHIHEGQVKIPFWGAIFVPSIYDRKYAEGFINENGKNLIITWGYWDKYFVHTVQLFS